jgi:hypothetical protein
MEGLLVVISGQVGGGRWWEGLHAHMHSFPVMETASQQISDHSKLTNLITELLSHKKEWCRKNGDHIDLTESE